MARTIEMQALLHLSIGQELGQFRAVPINLGAGEPNAFLAFYAGCYDIDASTGMFAYPTDTMKIIVFDETGAIRWRRELGKSLVPGGAFCPFYAFDLNGDGVEEIWFVNNTDPVHPFAIGKYVLERVDPLTGETSGLWKWPYHGGAQSLSHTFRNHLLGGYVNGEPVLVTAQGTYGPMSFQAWRPGMASRWERFIANDDPGARGSHVYPIVDINSDGIDEVMWGERCFELDKGGELFCADCNTWRGHSDMAQPIWDPAGKRWFVYVNRETDGQQSPRVILYDDHGECVWDAVDHGHIHKGWVGRIGPNGQMLATAIRIGSQAKGPAGRFYEGVSEFVFNALTGEPRKLGFSIFDTSPVDVNGDGRHEMLRGIAAGGVELIDRSGAILAKLGGKVSMASKLLHHPGEQVCCFYPDGTVRFWGDANAEDSPAALKRYAHPFYRANTKFPTTENRLCMLGGV